MERNGDIQAYRSDRRVIAHTHPRAEPQFPAHQVQVLADISTIDEHCGTKIRANALTEVDRARLDGGAPYGIAVWKDVGADGLVAVAANRAAAACIEALVRWQAELACADGDDPRVELVKKIAPVSS